jgi:outer membrane receptor protein involved in Fe transport
MALDGIEVVLGPGSVLYGSGAMGGVVHYLPAAIPDAEGLFGRGLVRGSSAAFGTEASVLAGGRDGALGGWVGGAFRRRGELRTGGGGEVPLSENTSADWRGRVAYDLGGGWELRGSYLAGLTRDAGRSDNVGKADVRIYDNDDHLAWIDVERRGTGALRSIRLDVSWHRLTEHVDRYSCLTNEGGTVLDREACLRFDEATLDRKRRYDDQVDAFGGFATTDWRWLGGKLGLTAGLEGRMEAIGSTQEEGKASEGFAFKPKDRGNFSDGSTYGMADAFAYLEGRPFVREGTVEVVLDGGARVHSVSASAPDVPGLGEGGEPADVDYSHTGLVGSAGLRTILGNVVNVYANWSQGFRAPNLQETTALGDQGTYFEVPNDDLGPERSDSYELGVKAHLPWLQVGAAGFIVAVRDAIVRENTTHDGQDTVNEKQVSRNVNAEEATYRGADGWIETAEWNGVALLGRAAWLEGDVTQADGSEVPATRVPPLHGLLGLRWRGLDGRVEAGAGVRWAGDQDRLSPGDRKDLRMCEDPENPGKALGETCEGTPGWTSLDVRLAGYPTADKKLRLDLAVENALDTDYRLHGSGYDSPGIDVRLTARYEL